MTQNIRTIAIVDARSLDGSPYEVAEQAVAQALALTQLATEHTEIAQKMGRNAEDERNLVLTGEVGATEYEATPQGKGFAAAASGLEQAAQRLVSLRKAVAFNPKARVPKEAK